MNIGAKELRASFANTTMRSWADLSASSSRFCTTARDSFVHTGDAALTKVQAEETAASLHLLVDFDCGQGLWHRPTILSLTVVRMRWCRRSVTVVLIDGVVDDSNAGAPRRRQVLPSAGITVPARARSSLATKPIKSLVGVFAGARCPIRGDCTSLDVREKAGFSSFDWPGIAFRGLSATSKQADGQDQERAAVG